MPLHHASLEGVSRLVVAADIVIMAELRVASSGLYLPTVLEEVVMVGDVDSSANPEVELTILIALELPSWPVVVVLRQLPPHLLPPSSHSRTRILLLR